MAESVMREDETAACSGARPFYVPHCTRLVRDDIRRSMTILQRISRTTQQTDGPSDSKDSSKLTTEQGEQRQAVRSTGWRITSVVWITAAERSARIRRYNDGMAQDIALAIVLLLLFAAVMAFYDWNYKRMRARSTNPYLPTTFQVIGLGVTFVAVGLGMHITPPRWPEWLRNVIAMAAFAAIYWGGNWMLRRLGGRGPF